jgi:hypothetical protein
MRKFLDANPGLASRFSKTIQFENYSAAELVQITGYMVAGGDYVLDKASIPMLLKYYGSIADDPNFGNARDARRLFESLRKVQSQRLRLLGHMPDMAELRTLTAEDVLAVTG